MFQVFQGGYRRISDTTLLFYRWLASLLEGKKANGNIRVLDGIRAIACLSVVMFHINLITTHDISLWTPSSIPSLFNALAFAGDTGVTLFFILSGFLLFLPYAKALLFDDAAWPSVRQFYLRRALRILPVYYLSLFLMVVLFDPQYLHAGHLHQWVFFLTMFMDSSVETYKQINGPFWTLAVEWQFYLVLPWLALGMSWLVRRGGTAKRRFLILTTCLSTIAIWGILTRVLGLYLTTYPHKSIILPRSMMNYILPFIYGPAIAGMHGKFLEDFAVGMFICALYTLSRKLPLDHYIHFIIQKCMPWLFMLGLTWLIVMAMWKLNVSQPHTWSLFDSLNDAYNVIGEFCYALGYGFCVTAILFGNNWLKRSFEWKPLCWIGIVSYGIYMWHLLLLQYITPHITKRLPDIFRPALYGVYWLEVFILILPAAMLLFIVIEKPAMRLGKLALWGENTRPGAVTSRTPVTLAGGYIGLTGAREVPSSDSEPLEQGFPQRIETT